MTEAREPRNVQEACKRGLHCYAVDGVRPQSERRTRRRRTSSPEPPEALTRPDSAEAATSLGSLFALHGRALVRALQSDRPGRRVQRSRSGGQPATGVVVPRRIGRRCASALPGRLLLHSGRRPGPHLSQEAGRINCIAEGLPHDKCYAPTTHTSYPPKRPWICRRPGCLRIGVDVERMRPVTDLEYNRLWAEREAQAA